MDTFAALADPTRRHIVELLARHGSLTAGELAERFDSARPTISRHLRVLREAGVVRARPIAQERHYVIDTKSLEKTEAWLARNRRLWSDRFAALERHLKESP